MRAYFFPRLLSYLIDIFLLAMILGIFSFAIPENKNIETLNKEYKQLNEEYLDKKINVDEYMNRSKDVVYELDYARFPEVAINLVLVISYFVVFQFYNKGQTIGKRIMKIRVVSNNDNELTINNYIFRSMIINYILLDLLILGTLLFLGRDVYYYLGAFLKVLETIIFIVTGFMVLYRKDGRGFHDLIANTKVIMDEEESR
ncbi:MAG: RDD family protein [Bacilli bacterium]|nr:RDD family protein [Bacilli bacterium]